MRKLLSLMGAAALGCATSPALQAAPEKGPYLGVSTTPVEPAVAAHLDLPPAAPRRAVPRHAADGERRRRRQAARAATKNAQFSVR